MSSSIADELVGAEGLEPPDLLLFRTHLQCAALPITLYTPLGGPPFNGPADLASVTDSHGFSIEGGYLTILALFVG